MATSPDLPSRLHTLKKKLNELVKRRSTRKFLPPYTAEQLAEVEGKLGVALPDDMRAFVTEVTQGEEDTGFPPMYPPHDGLLLLGKGDQPSAPFEATEEDARALIEKDMQRDPDDRPPAREAAMNGLLPILDHGCGELDVVALTGPQRGRMWRWWEDGLSPLYVAEQGRASHLDYLAWVAREIDDALESAPPPIDVGSKEISLTGRDLAEVPPEVFEAKGLESLNLSNNLLTSLPEALATLPVLRRLLLSSNMLRELPPWIGELVRLEHLDLYNNPLERLPPSLGRLAALSGLRLTSTRIRELPAEIGDLTSLAELSLEDTPLEALPDTVGNLQSLKVLKISRTRLRRLPEELARVPVEELDLEDMPDLDVEQAVSVAAGIPALRILGVYDTKRVPASLSALSQVTRLRLIRMGLRSVPAEVYKLTGLATLALDQNEITTLPEELFALPHLKTVVLFSNPVDKEALADLRARHPAVQIMA